MSDEYDWTRDHDFVGEDPEVAADRALKSATLRERGGQVRSMPTWAAPTLVAWWPCQTPKCAETIGVPQDTVERLAIFNTELERRGERRIPEGSILLCPEHTKARQGAREEAQAKRRDRIRDNVRLLKGAADPALLPDVIAELRRDHHPDVEGLLAALAAKSPKRKDVRL